MSDELLPLRDLEADEIGWLLTELARRRSITDIKKDFDYAFAPKTVSGGELLALPKRYPDLYRQAERNVLADISHYALAHAALRLEALTQGLAQARIPQPSHSVRRTNPNTQQDEWIEVMDYNFSAQAKFIELAQREEHTAKKLLLERLRLDADIPELRRSGFKNTITVATGFEDDEDVVNHPIEGENGPQTPGSDSSQAS